MNTHNFILILDGSLDEAVIDLLFEAGLDDAAVTAFEGHPALDVDREAATLLEAIASAIAQVESVDAIQVVRVEGEELVSQADIADRTGRSRQAVNHWVKRDADSGNAARVGLTIPAGPEVVAPQVPSKQRESPVRPCTGVMLSEQ